MSLPAIGIAGAYDRRRSALMISDDIYSHLTINVPQVPTGPADMVYQAYGPIGLLIVMVCIMLSPMIFYEKILPRIFPIFAPAFLEFMLFIDEFEDDEKQQKWIRDPKVKAEVKKKLRNLYANKHR